MVRRLLPALTLALIAAPLAQLAPAAAAPDAPSERRTQETRRAASQVELTSWSDYGDFKAGKRQGVKISQGALEIKQPRTRRVAGRAWDSARWTSPWAETGFPATSVIPSWEATTPGRSMVRVEVRGRVADGTTGSWDSVADWSTRSNRMMRTTHSGQSDDLGRVNVDTWVATTPVTAWQLRVTLLRKPGKAQPVSVQRIGAVASVTGPAAATSRPGPGVGTVLPVPSYSQMVHEGHYPQWGGGGEAWCSAASTTMVLDYYGVLPEPRGIAAGHVDAAVDHTAKMVFDNGYDGTGNWAFNTAYAATLVGGDSYVTRLRDLREAEDYITAGVPLVVSIAFGRNQLSGAPISASNGHLLVIVGFEADGDVVVNDPAGETNAKVRRVYDRAQFERLWQTASGGTAYVIRNS